MDDFLTTKAAQAIFDPKTFNKAKMAMILYTIYAHFLFIALIPLRLLFEQTQKLE
jgi:hypothetical protein